MKQTITLFPLIHENSKQIGIKFLFRPATKQSIKDYPGTKWSDTHKTYYVTHQKHTLHKLFKHLVNSGFYVDFSAFQNFKNPEEKLDKKGFTKIKSPDKVTLYQALDVANKTVLKEYISYLRGKRLSDSTVASYGYFMLRFIYSVKNIEQKLWNTRCIELYMEQVIAKEFYSISSHRQCVSAFKHFTTFCDIDGFDAANFERPKKSRYLPTVLSKGAIINLLQVTKNLKHRTIIGLIYSGGLRVGELLNLQITDLDFDRSMIFIKQGKGRKDRLVGMSEAIKPLLMNYLNTYTPKNYVIEGREGSVYSASSIRAFLNKSCKLAGITKRVTPHTLRHSYATHMLENGIDIRYIQELLGHAKPETTMIYTHVAQKDVLQIKNPLDVTIEEMQLTEKAQKKVSISRKYKY